MSQTETLMLVALGFALALILVLLLGRLIWNMAMSVGARRQAKLVPVKILDLQADRDRLRAEHAMMARKVELRLDEIKIRMTEQMAEVSRNRNRVQSLLQEMERRDESIRNRDREVGSLRAHLEVDRADLSAYESAVTRLTNEVAAKEAQINKLAAANNKVMATLREKNALISRLSLELRTTSGSLPAMPHPELADVVGENHILQRVAELTSISTKMVEERSEPVAIIPITPPVDSALSIEPPNHQAELDQKLAETERQSQAMADELKALDEMLAASLEPATKNQPKKPGAMANVISLAQRIRALQSG